GVIGSADELAGTFVMHGYVDDDLSLDLGNLTVAVDGSTLFVDDDGATLDSAGFFAAVVAGSTLVEVHGVLSGETLAADRIEVEDHSGGSSVASQVKIEGVLTDLQIGGGTLLVLDVKKGEEDAELILGGLGDPDSIEISFDNTTIVIDDDTVGDSSALVVGQRLVVSFPTFTGEPFFASKIDLKSEAQYEGVLTDVDAPGEAATATLDDDDLAIATGLVDDDTTEVAIDLTGSTFELDTDGHPALTIDDLVVGLKVELEGTFGGSSSSPTFAATKLKVHAGEAEGTVDLVDSDLRLFMASIAEVDDPWGDVDPDSLSTFFLTDSVVFTGDVSTEQEFFDAFAALGTGETLEVEVQGLVTDSLNYYFDVYEVKVELASN
ncbi:MAG: hypothetical protein IT453_18455, partial [Planctomycetes bacterium]|nr:hypothetical protein [Planctomycetota bacterium]